jgi:hypothetical protein
MRLLAHVKREGIERPPAKSLFALFASYGFLLVFVLSLVGVPLGWSGMHTIGMLFFALVGAPLLLVQGIAMTFQVHRSGYHRAVQVASLALGIPAVGFLVWMFLVG